MNKILTYVFISLIEFGFIFSYSIGIYTEWTETRYSKMHGKERIFHVLLHGLKLPLFVVALFIAVMLIGFVITAINAKLFL